VPLRVQHGAAQLVVDGARWQALQACARRADPALTDGDLRGALCDRLDHLRDVHSVATLLIEEPTGVRLSMRSAHDGRASDVASAFGGGGHGRSAGAFVAGAAVVDVAARLQVALHQTALQTELSLRAGRLAAGRTTFTPPAGS
jgi:c-di-AMP phosphodiesterase-like protein